PPHRAASAVLAFGVRCEHFSAAFTERDEIADPFDHGCESLLRAQPILPLEAEGQAEEVNLRDVGPGALAVEVVEVREEAVAGGVRLEELELKRVLQPLRLSRPVRVVDDLVGEGG